MLNYDRCEDDEIVALLGTETFRFLQFDVYFKVPVSHSPKDAKKLKSGNWVKSDNFRN
jgi:hypothetical protein